MKFRDAIKLAFDPSAFKAQRELERVRKQPRYTPGWTKLFGHPLEYVDSSSYFFLHEAIFREEVYAFTATNTKPRIIDGGANIGLATIYFKRLFPDARITAFEADPVVAKVLQRNLEAQGMADIDIQQAALWSCDTELSFYAEGADGGRISLSDETTIQIPAVALLQYLDQPVDFLKLDIEGAEFEVLKSCQNKLGMVNRAFIEYHSNADQPQTLPELLALLKEADFRCFISTPSVFSPKPFVEINSYSGFDMVLNIFCTRAENCSMR